MLFVATSAHSLPKRQEPPKILSVSYRKRLNLSGGRAGTRPPDLLRVKKKVWLHLFHGFQKFSLRFNNLGHLLGADSLNLLFASDGLLIRS